MDEQRHADEADESEDAAGDHRQQLFAFHRNAERLVDLWRREQAEEMAEEEQQNADVEKHAAPIELLSAQELARLGTPSVLAAVEPRPAAQEKHDHAEIGIEAEQELVDEAGHGCTCLR